MAPATDVPTQDIRINPALLREQQNKYPAVHAELRDAIPTELYPTAEASPQATYHGHPFYPGRVLLGTNDGSRVWGYLRRVRKNYRTVLELHYDDNRAGEEDHTPFAQSDFLPWCRILVDEACPIGAHEWEERVKRVVKVVMLEAGYSESVVSQIPPAQLTAIQRNLEKGLNNLPRAAGLDPESPTNQIATPVAPPSAPNSSEEAKDSAQQPVVYKPKLRKGPGAHYIKVLKDAIHPDYWFQASPIPAHEERRIILLEPDSKEYFALFPGKVLLGHLRDNDETSVWAAFRRPKPAAKVQTLSGSWRMCFFDDNLLEIELSGTLDGTVEFAPAFQLLTEDRYTAGTSRVWFARLSTCVRVTLIDAGLQDDVGFVTREDAQPKELASVIKKNWARLRRIFQRSERETKRTTSQPEPTRKSRKTRTAGASATIATAYHQAPAPGDDESSNRQQQSKALMTFFTDLEMPEDEGDIMETGYERAKSDKQFIVAKRESTPAAPKSSMVNKKQKTTHPNGTSLLDFIDFTTAKNTTDTAAFGEQVRVLTEAKAALKKDNEKKNERIIDLELTTSDIKEDMNEYKKRV